MKEHILHELLITKGLSLGLAESCTGGKIASLFTAIPGSSNYFKGGIVSYSNEAKNEILKVNKKDIELYGAVSKEVVEQMACGAQQILHADCSIATSGIAGPDGGTIEKPVGTVWIAAAYKDKLVSKKFLFSNDRAENILKSSNAGIQMLLDLLV
ncbi:nicotinamide-nucleotide amidase [Dysgonomonadaceae bacterium PH5-43]|nr:nicotinamide-nucleotide amidase [Dysgonomonadaceae bacterium PH5-43]